MSADRWSYRTSGRPDESQSTRQPRGCRLEDYAAAKGLPTEYLRGLGISELSYLGSPALRIPYFDRSGQAGGVDRATGRI